MAVTKGGASAPVVRADNLHPLAWCVLSFRYRSQHAPDKTRYPDMNNFHPIHGYSLSKVGNASKGYAASQRQPSGVDHRLRCAYA